jgi:hypothetical protein
MAGVYQSALTVVMGPTKEGPDGEPGARMTSKKDPARSQDHGHQSGVRRDSASETQKAEPTPTPETEQEETTIAEP